MVGSHSPRAPPHPESPPPAPTGGRSSTHVDPVELLCELQERLQRLDALLQRLSTPAAEGTDCPPRCEPCWLPRQGSASNGSTPHVSPRELTQARSQTGLYARIQARLLFEQRVREPGAFGGASPALSRPPTSASALGAPRTSGGRNMSATATFFEYSELLEHMLSFVTSPGELARHGAVCTSWYLASRLHTLWERMLRSSGRLVGPGCELLPIPYEEEYTLFETFGRIHRHGCRPLNPATDAAPPLPGTIDRYVDDLAAYKISAQLGELSGAPQQVSGDALAMLQRGAGGLYLATHATRGHVVIRSLTSSHSAIVCTAMSGKRPSMPLPTSPHLQPVLQAICEGRKHAYLVQPVFESSLELRLKASALHAAHAHRIFCQLAHALASLHAQGYAHGSVLISSVLLVAHDRPPFARLDQIYTARRVAWPAADDPAPSGPPLPADHSPTSPLDVANDGAAEHPSFVPLALPMMSADAFEDDVDVSFDHLLSRAWNGYERLGTLGSVHFDPLSDLDGNAGADTAVGMLHDEVVAARADVSPHFAADISDLGRVLLRMLLQPYKRRAAAAAAPPFPEGFAALAAEIGDGADPPFAQGADLRPPPPRSAFDPALRSLLCAMFSPSPRRRPTAEQILRHPWVRSGAGVTHGGGSAGLTHEHIASTEAPARIGGNGFLNAPLCSCWNLINAAAPSRATPSDLRLLRRPMPPFQQVSLAGSAAVTDEWLEALAANHAGTLERLDVSGCDSLSASQRPLVALTKFKRLRLLRLPAQRWEERALANALSELPQLCWLDEASTHDLHSARDALADQCAILENVRVLQAASSS